MRIDIHNEYSMCVCTYTLILFDGHLTVLNHDEFQIINKPFKTKAEASVENSVKISISCAAAAEKQSVHTLCKLTLGHVN